MNKYYLPERGIANCSSAIKSQPKPHRYRVIGKFACFAHSFLSVAVALVGRTSFLALIDLPPFRHRKHGHPGRTEARTYPEALR